MLNHAELLYPITEQDPYPFSGRFWWPKAHWGGA